jgi:hypothetical protein
MSQILLRKPFGPEMMCFLNIVIIGSHKHMGPNNTFHVKLFSFDFRLQTSCPVSSNLINMFVSLLEKGGVASFEIKEHAPAKFVRCRDTE